MRRIGRECPAGAPCILCRQHADLFDDVGEDDLLCDASALCAEFACCGCGRVLRDAAEPPAVPDAQLSEPLLCAAPNAAAQDGVHRLHVAGLPAAGFSDGKHGSRAERRLTRAAHSPCADKIVDVLRLRIDAALFLCQ